MATHEIGSVEQSNEEHKDFPQTDGEAEMLTANPSDESDGAQSGMEEDEEDEVNVTREPTVKEVFDDIIAVIEGGEPGAEERTVEGIIKKYDKHLDQITNDNTQPSLLHTIVKRCTRKNLEKMTPLIERLVRRNHKMLEETDRYGNTPLMVAVQSGIYRLIKCICGAMPKDFVDQVLIIADSNGSNCLHEAMCTTPQIALELIDRINNPENVLLAQNGDKLTALHLSVDYNRCNGAQFGVVKRLVSLCDAALDTHTLSEDPSLRSVFRHHEHTRRLAAERERKKKEKEKEKAKYGRLEGGNSYTKPNVKDIAVTSNAQAASYPIHRTAAPEKQVPVPNQRALRTEAQGQVSNTKDTREGGQDFIAPKLAKSFSGHENMGRRNQQDGLAKMSQLDALKHEEGDLTRRPSFVGPMPNPQATEPTAGKVSKTQTSKNMPSKGKSSKKKIFDCVSEGHANTIRDYLKLHYMCTREDHEMITGFLYEPKEVKQIFFGLAGGPASVSMQQLKDMKSILDFDETLQYVELPNFKMESIPPRRANISRKKTTKEPYGRQDHKMVLDWLKEEGNGVKRIVNLTVDDNNPPDLSHNDETIEEALKGLEILKRWDWQRLDLSSEILRITAKDVSEVVLYWSGSNAVLRGWGEQEGLNSLDKLEKLTINGVQGLETYERTARYLKKFEDRLVENREKKRAQAINEKKKHIPPKIVVMIQLKKSFKRNTRAEGSQRQIQDPRKELHDWLKTMDDFANFLRTNELIDEGEMAKRPIKIAVIDDGIDISENLLEGKVMGGASFYLAQDNANIHAPWWVTQGYHGTIMASLISRICPGAKLFVVRLDEKMSEGKRNITAKSAEKAIRSAMLNDVDIISMSWTIEDADNNEIAKLISTVQKAVEKNILLFCAAKDQLGPDKSHPGASTPSRFKIGAATQYGQQWEGVGESDVDFIFPGHNVIYNDPREVPIDKCNTTLLTGSSVATALAAGLAGLILYCVQLAAVAERGSGRSEVITMKDFDSLKSYKRMHNAFRNIPPIASSNKFLAVWKVFGSKQKVDLMKPEDKYKRMVDVAKALIRQDVGDV